jgi:hypothetical protein
MNPPDVYDADGHPYDRRHASRREDDPAVNVTRGYEFWTKLMFLHRGKLTAMFSTGALASGYLLGVMGTPKEIARVERKVDTLALEVVRVKASVADGASDRARLKERLEFVIYMQCMAMRRTDPAAVPPLCNETRRP